MEKSRFRQTHEEKVLLFHLEMEGMTRWFQRGEVDADEWAQAAARVSQKMIISVGSIKAVAWSLDPSLYEAVERLAA